MYLIRRNILHAHTHTHNINSSSQHIDFFFQIERDERHAVRARKQGNEAAEANKKMNKKNLPKTTPSRPSSFLFHAHIF